MSLRARLVLWYLTSVGALAAVPFIAMILGDRGIPDPTIAMWMALLPFGSLFAAPTWAWMADRSGRSRSLLALTALGTTTGFVLLTFAQPAGWLFCGLALYAIARAPQVPMVDALAVQSMGDGGRNYGRVRLWGSVAFLVAGGIAGSLRNLWDAAPLAMGTLLLAGTLPAVLLLPSGPPPQQPARLRALSEAFLRGDTALLAMACTLHGLGLTFYNNFLGRHFESLGLPPDVLGISLVVAVVVEVALMAAAPFLLARVPAPVLLLIALGASIPRWIGTAWTTDPFLLVALQSLHGLSFGLFWVTAVPTFAQVAPPSVARSAQAALTATAFGLGPLLAAPIGWWLLGEYGTGSLYSAAAVASVLATAIALPLARRARASLD